MEKEPEKEQEPEKELVEPPKPEEIPPKTKRKPPAPKPKAAPATDAPAQIPAAGAMVDPHFFGALSQTLKRMQRAERTNRLSTLQIV